MMPLRPSACTLLLALAACSANAPSIPSGAAVAAPSQTQAGLYQPLKVGDSWTYTCRDIKGGGENGNRPFTIRHRVLASTNVGRVPAYEFSLQVPQVPSKPLKIVTTVMLLDNDAHGNLWIDGYLVHKSVRRIKRALIVSATPVAGRFYDYTGPTGAVVSRYFYGIESSNPTPMGTFTVADYEESRTTHDYGYAKSFGIAEEDHGPNFEVDCLVASAHIVK